MYGMFASVGRRSKPIMRIDFLFARKKLPYAPHVNILSLSHMSSRRLRGLAPEIDPKTSPSRQSRAHRRARRSRAITKAEGAPFQAVAADDSQKGTSGRRRVARRKRSRGRMGRVVAGRTGETGCFPSSFVE